MGFESDALVSSVAGNYGGRSPQQNLKIQPERPATRILQVQANHFVEADAATSFYLPQARDSRLDFQYAAAVPDIVLAVLIGQRRPRAHERHFAPQYVDELRQFIEACPADDLPDRSDSRIVFHLVHRLAVRALLFFTGDHLLHERLVDLRIVIGVHGTELQALEGRPELSQAVLFEQNWALGRQL